jgi:hypothetical protein
MYVFQDYLRNVFENFGTEIVGDWNSVEKLLTERLPRNVVCMKGILTVSIETLKGIY